MRAWADDGYVDGPIGSDEVTILNTPPTCGGAAILPSAGTTVDSFECGCTDRDDADGDPPDGDLCVWEADGIAVQAGSCTLPPGLVVKGQSLVCVFTAHDGAAAAEPVNSPSVPILNAAPLPPVVRIDPPNGGLGTAFTCDVLQAGADPDGDQLTWEYTWVLGGFDNPGVTSQTVIAGSLVAAADGTSPKKGDPLRCRVQASDGPAKSVPGDSPPVFLGNSPPTGGKVLVDPAVATESTTLTCVGADAKDPDGDPISWLWAWHVHGETVPGQASQTLGGAFFDKGDLVGCTATPSDGAANGLPLDAKNPVTIQNTLPALETVTVAPAVTDQLGTFICGWSGWLDPDPADPPQVDLQWQVLGEDEAWADVPLAVGGSLPAAGYVKGTQVRCVATPRNGGLLGVPGLSNVAEVGNSLPTLGAATIVPGAGGPCEAWTCVASGVTDPDPDETVLVAYRWTVNDQPAGPPKSALTGVVLAPGDSLRCFARATDGTLDDAQQTVYGPEVLSTPVVVGNSAPQVAAVALTPEVASPLDTLACDPSGISDADACHEGQLEVLYKWYAEGALVDGADGPTLAASGLPVGTEIVCQVVVGDGYVFGAPKLSNPAVIGPADAIVAISAPQGAAGAVTCELVQAATYSEPLTYVWLWTFNGGPVETHPQTLPAGQVADCDLVTCRTEASANAYTVISNTASEAFPVGPGCDDADACTSEVCLAGGGCDHPPHTGPCDDGNPCSEGEHCDAGFCVGGAEVDCDDFNPCTEDLCSAAQGCLYLPGPAGPCGPGDIGTCIDGDCCIPQCLGVECGDDGCGGTCGGCDEPEVCDVDEGLCIGPTPGMVILPADGFWMGCNDKDDSQCKLDEYPFHAAIVDSYEIDVRQVTAASYEACVDTFTCFPPGSGPGCNYQVAERANHPINCVNWYDAETYCAWIDKRLCTEAEWERAARGDDGRKYPWGFNEPDCDLAVMPDEGGTAGCGTGGTLPVGSKPDGASPYGVLDMSGQVYDWTADWYWEVYYEVAPQVNPTGPDTGLFKVRRGGGFDSPVKDLRVSSRHQSTPSYGAVNFGFRCCKDFPP